MTHWKLTLMYDGTAFHGWQVQPGLPTVQGTLAEALQQITGETLLPQGSGRTDTGVHALGQTCSFALQSPLPATNLRRALNQTLPSSIRVLEAAPAAPGFHARHSARCKTYEYRIFERRPPLPVDRAAVSRADAGQPGARDPGARDPEQDRLCSPFLAPFVWDVRWRLDLQAMQIAAAAVCGTHDFTSFAAVDPERTLRDEQAEQLLPIASGAKIAGAVRTIFHSSWDRREEHLIYRVTGSGFLHHMVRNLVGTMVDVGRGSLAAETMLPILAAQDRRVAGPTAPARGLFLLHVNYGSAAEEALHSRALQGTSA